MLQREIVFYRNSCCQTSEPENFRIREYVSAVRGRDPDRCWPFESVCDLKNLDTQQDLAPESESESESFLSLKLPEHTNAPELPQVEISKGKEVVEYEAPIGYVFEILKGNGSGSKNATASELELTEGYNTLFETAFALLEISSGNNTQAHTARASELEVPKGNKTRSENATAVNLELTMGNNTAYESDTATEIIISKEVNDGMDEMTSYGATELVNLSESENEESVNEGGTKTEISMISDNANSGKASKDAKKRKFRLLSELLRDLAGPNVESTVHFAGKVDENTDSSDEEFTIDNEDGSDADTLGMFLRKRKAMKITCTTNGSRSYKKKKTHAPKPSNHGGPKGSKARTKRAVAEVAPAANKKRRASSCDRPSGTGQSVGGQPVAEVGGSEDLGLGLAVGPPGKQRTMVCALNKIPTDFTIVGPGNNYMR